MRSLLVALVAAPLVTTLTSTPATTAPATSAPATSARLQTLPGAAGIGDPYFPEDGNGGYRVRHYDVHLRYLPQSGRLDGRATLTVRTTRPLSRFNLDLQLPARSVRVDGRPAAAAPASPRARGLLRHGTPRAARPPGPTARAAAGRG